MKVGEIITRYDVFKDGRMMATRSTMEAVYDYLAGASQGTLSDVAWGALVESGWHIVKVTTERVR